MELAFDSEYSWLVAVAIVFNNLAGMAYLFGSAGVLASEYPKLLQLDVSQTNLVGSVLIGVFKCSVPVSALLIKRFGCRPIAAIGCVLHITGVTSSAFASELWHLILGYAIIGGLGISMNMMSTVAIVPHYFKKHVSVAYACVGVGSGIGFITYPYAMKAILSTTPYKDMILYMLPISAISISAPIIFRGRKIRESSLTIGYRELINPLKNFAAPFYLLNSLLWNAGHVGMLVILFNYVLGVTGQHEAAALNSLIYGICYFLGTVILTVSAVKLNINHFGLQIMCNLTGGTAAILIGCFSSQIALHVLAGVVGICQAIVVSIMPHMARHLYAASDVELSFAYQNATGAVGALVAPWTAALIQKAYGSKYGPIYMGSSLVLGAFLLISMICIRNDSWYAYHCRPIRSKSLPEVSKMDLNSSQLASTVTVATVDID